MTRIEHDRLLLPADLRCATLVYACATQWAMTLNGIAIDVEWVGEEPYVHWGVHDAREGV
jgi:hypothetical protein